MEEKWKGIGKAEQETVFRIWEVMKMPTVVRILIMNAMPLT